MHVDAEFDVIIHRGKDITVNYIHASMIYFYNFLSLCADAMHVDAQFDVIIHRGKDSTMKV
jgi:hypothetical protein